MTLETETMNLRRRDAERIAAELYAIREQLAARNPNAAAIPWAQLSPLTRSFETDIIEQALAEDVILP